MDTIIALINSIQPIDERAGTIVQRRFDSLIKPQGSLGLLEEMTVQIAGIRGAALLSLPNKCLINVTAAKEISVPAFIPLPGLRVVSLPLMQKGRLKEEAILQLICQGAEAAGLQIDQGAQVLGISQNAMDERDVQALAEELLSIKQPCEESLVAIICLLKRYENRVIAILLGIILVGAVRRVPVVLDGLATVCAALAACRLNPNCSRYMIGIYLSSYPEHEKIFTMLGWRPGLPLRLSVGGGIGAILTLSLLDAGIKAFIEMGTFAEAGVSVALQDLPQRQDYC